MNSVDASGRLYQVREAAIVDPTWLSNLNKCCTVLVLAILVARCAWQLRKNTVASSDFAQFYMGGVVAWSGQWESLYPIPRAGSLNNPGMPGDSDMMPAYAALAKSRGLGDHTRFIQPPFAAVLFIPLAWTSYPHAYMAWEIVSAILAWGMAVLAGRTYRSIVGGLTLTEVVIVVWTGLGGAMCASINMGNISVVMGFLVSLTVSCFLARKYTAAIIVMLLGASVKYVTIAMAPMAYFASRRSLLRGAFSVFAVLLSSVAISGWKPYVRFVRLLPMLSRPWLNHWMPNHTVAYMVFHHIAKQNPLPVGWSRLVAATQLGVLLVVCRLLFLCRRQLMSGAELLMAGCGALVAWFMLFSPIVWGHYVVYLVSFFPWIVWEASQSKWRAILGVSILWLLWGPFQILSVWREPGRSSLFWAEVLMLFLAVMRLVESRPTSRSVGELGISVEYGGCEPTAAR